MYKKAIIKLAILCKKEKARFYSSFSLFSIVLFSFSNVLICFDSIAARFFLSVSACNCVSSVSNSLLYFTSALSNISILSCLFISFCSSISSTAANSNNSISFFRFAVKNLIGHTINKRNRNIIIRCFIINHFPKVH